MRKITICVALVEATAFAGCVYTPPPPSPVSYAPAPPPGARRCVEFREDIYGRRYCSAFYRA